MHYIDVDNRIHKDNLNALTDAVDEGVLRVPSVMQMITAIRIDDETDKDYHLYFTDNKTGIIICLNQAFLDAQEYARVKGVVMAAIAQVSTVLFAYGYDQKGMELAIRKDNAVKYCEEHVWEAVEDFFLSYDYESSIHAAQIVFDTELLPEEKTFYTKLIPQSCYYLVTNRKRFLNHEMDEDESSAYQYVYACMCDYASDIRKIPFLPLLNLLVE